MHGQDAVRRALEQCGQPLRLYLIFDRQLALLGLGIAYQAGAETLFRAAVLCLGEMRVDGPVLPRRETLDLAFPFHDQPRRHRLHAAGGEAAPDLLPEEGAQAVTDQPVQHASCLLGVHELHIDFTGVAERFAHRLGRYLVEHHTDVVLALQFGSRN